MGEEEHSTTSPASEGAEAGAPAPGEVIASKYVVESLLGVGGMGVVVAALHAQLNQRVAIKLLRREASFTGSTVARFLREARAAASISSEHVARVLDVGTLDNGLPFIVMEHLSGADLADLLTARGRIPHGEAVSLVLQACEAIAEAHAIGIVHRDLKPSNLFVTRRADGSPLVKVLDFGISKMQNPITLSGEAATLTASGSVVGSPAYMSPEQIRSARGTDARSDVWAVGIILYELVTGRCPFIGETLGDTLIRIASETPPPMRDFADVPPELEAIVLGCLERDLARRVPSIADLAKGLAPFADDAAVMSVERIVRVAASSRPVAVTPPEDDPLFAGTKTTPRWKGREPIRTEGAWQRSDPPRSRGPLRAFVAIGALFALAAAGSYAWVRTNASRGPVVGIAIDAAPIEPAATEVAPAVASPAAAPIEASTPIDAALPAPAPRATPAGRRRPAPTPTPEPASAPAPAPAPRPASAPDAGPPRSLDDLLEGRH